MPISINEIVVPQGAKDASSDIFLSIVTKRAGKVKGESKTDGHVDEIQLSNWHWGARAGEQVALSAGKRASRSYSDLHVTKVVDLSSTALLNALATNDMVREAVLTMRKAGGDALDYFKMTLNDASITAVDISCGVNGQAIESVTLSFTKVTIEYKRQQSGGASGGATTFSDDIAALGPKS